MNVADYTAPINELVTAVKNAVSQADVSAANSAKDMQIGSVQLVLNAVATTKAGGSLDFRIPVIGWKVTVGASRTWQRTHTIDITLVPEGAQPRYEIRDHLVEGTLVEAINTIRAAIAAAGGGDDPLVLKTGSVELVFAVTDTGSISVGVDGELSDEITHTLKLELLPAKTP
ncbi:MULTISPECIES: trypco2 family protein [Micromonospora]|uniref:trypco2 family protein n=1 Tax=Micromonospora TaxID=1873 RepID=UPI0007DB4F7D|nr:MULTISPECIES: trypco2 family protein [Micromonospora]PPA58478.1 hypothetical protein BAW75_20000 [Micromonospora chalcea]